MSNIFGNELRDRGLVGKGKWLPPHNAQLLFPIHFPAECKVSLQTILLVSQLLIWAFPCTTEKTIRFTASLDCRCVNQFLKCASKIHVVNGRLLAVLIAAPPVQGNGFWWGGSHLCACRMSLKRNEWSRETMLQRADLCNRIYSFGVESDAGLYWRGVLEKDIFLVEPRPWLKGRVRSWRLDCCGPIRD